ncbi:uncharacterized [Tachysurus ichikawai]
MTFQTCRNGRPKHNPAVRTEAKQEDKDESGVQSVGWRILPPEESRGLGSRAGSSLLFSQVKATSSYSQIPPYSASRPPSCWTECRKRRYSSPGDKRLQIVCEQMLTVGFNAN